MALQIVTSKDWLLSNCYHVKVYPTFWRRLLHWPVGAAVIEARVGSIFFRGKEYGCGGMNFEQLQRRAVEMIEQKAGL